MKWTFLILTCLCSVPILAQSKNFYLHLKTGEVISCSISRNPQISYGENYVRLTSTTMDLEYQMSEVNRLSFSPSASSIREITEDKGKMKNTEGLLTFSGYAPGSLIQVFSASGQILSAEKTDADGNLSIDLSSFSQGVYLINTNGSTYKIVKK